ncbi:hypothetical protein TL16_g04777, partial [Triparma laevis f. inornata]
MSSFAKPKLAEKPSVPELESGASIIKLGRRGAPHKRPFSLNKEGSHLIWTSSSFMKTKEMTRVDLTSVTRVTKGQSTIPFVRQASNLAVSSKASQSFSIIYEDYAGNETSLDLVCDTPTQFDTLFHEISELVKYHIVNKDSEDRVQRFCRRQWSMADLDGDGSLSFKEIEKLIQKLNIDLDRSYITKMFNEIDVDHSGTLDYLEFQALLDLLSKREDVYAIWCSLVTGAIFNGHRSVHAYCEKKNGTQYKEASIEAEVFHRFLTEIQKVNQTLEQTKLKIEAMKSEDESHDGKLRFANFRDYLNSGENSAYAIENTTNVYQDMNQPLSHYWCASSHNTYCESDQLKGYSSVNRYINDLMKGCRCVELDCWDGPKNDPIIFHGHTLTGQIKFKDVIEAVKEYAFQKSEFPIILSFENHCSIPQQKVMAKYCKQILGDMLVVPALRADGSLPSPDELKKKVVIKAKKLPKKNEDEDVIDEDFEEQKKAAESAKPKEHDAELSPDGPARRASFKKKKPKIAKELHDITFLSGVHFKSWEQSEKEAAANEMSSFSEPKTEKLIKTAASNWVEYNKKQMSRIYPAGVRIDSSNYNPIPSWNVGSQIVALNYQTSCFQMHLNDGKYMDNKNAGYILKPEALRSKEKTFDPVLGPFPASEALNFDVEVMSASQLPKPKGATKGEVIDPYVKVEVHGVPNDCKNCQTRVIDNNGFNPVFNESFSFETQMRSLGLLYIAVYDADQFDADDFIAYATIPLNSLREGIRNVHLKSWNGNNSGEFQFCSIMVNITFKTR